MNSDSKPSDRSENIVVSSRIRLARNIRGEIFPGRMDKSKGLALSNLIADAVEKSENLMAFGFEYISASGMSDGDKAELLSSHLASRELLQNIETGGILLSKDKRASLLINEEDHLRIQILIPGNHLEKAWKEADFIDDCLENSLVYAFDRNYGYLTACPSNVGTGLRASSMLHLPALVSTKYIKRVFDISNTIGLTVRGLYGEGSKAEGDMFQISNQVTGGKTEEEIIRDLDKITAHVLLKERQAREFMMNKQKIKTEDRIFRAMGILANARIASRAESMKLLSLVRLGVDLGIVENMDMETVDGLIRRIQFPESGETMESAVRRSEQIRNCFQ